MRTVLDDRSALTDCSKLATAGGSTRKAIVIYGFDAPSRPLSLAIEAFETLARRSVCLGARITVPYSGLVHPVFQQGAVFGWDVQPLR